MKKLALVLFGIIAVIAVAFAAQTYGLLNYFSKTPDGSSVKEQARNTSNAEPSRTVDRPLIGIYYKMIDKQTAGQNDLVEGAYITQVIKGSPAESADLREEDIITQFDDRKILGSDELKILTDLVAEKKPGDKVALKVWRNKKIMDISLVLALDQ